jgi:hypothetical protein
MDALERPSILKSDEGVYSNRVGYGQRLGHRQRTSQIGIDRTTLEVYLFMCYVGLNIRICPLIRHLKTDYIQSCRQSPKPVYEKVEC